MSVLSFPLLKSLWVRPPMCGRETDGRETFLLSSIYKRRFRSKPSYILRFVNSEYTYRISEYKKKKTINKMALFAGWQVIDFLNYFSSVFNLMVSTELNIICFWWFYTECRHRQRNHWSRLCGEFNGLGTVHLLQPVRLGHVDIYVEHCVWVFNACLSVGA